MEVAALWILPAHNSALVPSKLRLGVPTVKVVAHSYLTVLRSSRVKPTKLNALMERVRLPPTNVLLSLSVLPLITDVLEESVYLITPCVQLMSRALLGMRSVPMGLVTSLAPHHILHALLVL
jgi:hypothetical protein